MAQNNSTPQLSALDASILADLHGLSIRPNPEVPQALQNKGRSALYNKLYPHEKNPICPRQRDNYKPGKHFYYCPYSESGLCKDSSPPCRRPILNGSAVPKGEREPSDLQFQSGSLDLLSNSTRSDLLNLSPLDPSILAELKYVPSIISETENSSQYKNAKGVTGLPKGKKTNGGPRQEFCHKPTSRISTAPNPCEGDQAIYGAGNQNVTKRSNQSSARRQREQHQNKNEAEIAKAVYDYFKNKQNQPRIIAQNGDQCRNTNKAEIANIVHDYFHNEQNQRQSSSQNGDQRRNINVPEMLNTVRQISQGKQTNPGSLGRQPERRNSDMGQGNRPPSGPPTSCSLAGAGCNRRRNQAGCQNQKQPPRVWMPTNKPQKKSAFTLTDEQKALVLDNYYPGLIHDAVNQQADFNEIAKKYVTPETAVDGDKAEKGMSLIEAFDMRVKYEQINLTKLLGRNLETASKAKRGAKPYKIVHGPLAHPVVSDIVLEDNVRASAIPIDLQHYVRATPESDPVRAIACLTRAQQVNDYYKEYKAAQMAAHLAPSSKIEEAALQGVNSFRIQSLSADTKIVETEPYKSLELVSYIGVTKPD